MARRTPLPALLCALVLALAAGVAPAAAQTAPAAGSTTAQQAPATATDPNALTRPERMDEPPPLRRMTGDEVLAIAERNPTVVEAREEHAPTTSSVFLKGTDRWQVSFYDRDGAEVAQVTIQDATGGVLEAWSGPQVAWTMARGYPGAFGRKATALYVWLPLLIAFVLPFVDPRRPLRLRHLDLLMLCSLSVSLAFFSHGDIDASVPLAYPPLLYLLARLLWIAYRRGGPPAPREPSRLLVPVSWLAIATIFLVGFRIGLNVTDSNVIDVGYSGVIGADKLAHGHALYGAWPQDNEHGDTYGPVNYLLYIPFEAIWPWHGTWDDLPAAHAAAVFFDLLCLAGMFLLGRRLRGNDLGVVLAYAWASFPFTLFSLATNSNDALVAALLIGALLVATSAPARGAVAALAGLTKFAPLALLPLLSTHGAPPGGRLRTIGWFAAGFALTAFVVLMPVWLQGDLQLIYDRTVGFQLGRDAPFSIWGLYDGLEIPQRIVQAAAVLFAVAAAVLPRRPGVVALAAAAGAILLALQLGTTYWFYLYVVWVLPFAFLALLGREAEEAPPSPPEPRDARPEPVPA
ncbi:MAG TPA: hypothetical protein VFR97_01780 [Capillimicrobium sp.]|nr:hypothetical protein [Capillimicrobium sp.]